MPTLNVILEGPLPHHFIIAFDEYQRNATYYGEQATLSGGRRNHHADIRMKYGLDILSVLGGGVTHYEFVDGTQNQEVLVIGDSSKSFGAVIESILQLFETELLKRYQEIYPSINVLKLNPDVSKLKSNKLWNLDEIVKLLQAQTQ